MPEIKAGQRTNTSRNTLFYSICIGFPVLCKVFFVVINFALEPQASEQRTGYFDLIRIFRVGEN